MTSSLPRSLETRLAQHPEVLARMCLLADELEHAQLGPEGLDAVEDRVAMMVRELGREVLSGTAQRLAAQAPAPEGERVHRHGKKNSVG